MIVLEDFYLAARLTSFGVILAAMVALEYAVPRRSRQLARRHRWPGNLAMVAIASAAARLIVPLAVIGVAASVQAEGWGLLNQIMLPDWAEIAIAVILLDVAIYGQHVAFHALPWLWRIHRTHHSDPDLDVTTALRFHPLEIVLSLLFKFFVVAVLGASPIAVLVFEVLLNATAMFNHSNIALPLWTDALLRHVLVTPDMHRVHHSIDARETNSNFGFNLPWWDWLFRTYRAQPVAGHKGMTTGLGEFRTARDQRIGQLLIQPLRPRIGKGVDHD